MEHNSLFNPLSNHWLKNKFSYYAQLRERDALYYCKELNAYPITRYADVVHVLSTPSVFSSAGGNLVREFERRLGGNTLGSSDEPRHGELKNMVKSAYSREHVERICQRVEQQTIELLPYVDDMSKYLWLIACGISAELINFPLEFEKVRDLIYETQTHSSKSIDPTVYDTNEDAFLNLYHTMCDMAAQKVPALGPGIYKDAVGNAGDVQLASRFINVPVLAGTSSTVGALQYLILDLSANPDTQRALINDPSLVNKVINESLRYNTSTARFRRTVTEDVVIQGTQLHPGDTVIVCLDSANRDPDKFVNADVFDIEHDQSGSLAFGYGIHACAAQIIAKQAMSTFLTTFLKAHGPYKVLTDHHDLEYVITATGNFDVMWNIKIA